jgi:hypothetical protein
MARIAKKTRGSKEMSSERRAAYAGAAAKLLRRKGSMPTAQLLTLLGAEGLTLIEALSVVNHGFAHHLLMRDPGDPGGIAAGTASLPAPRRALVLPVLTAPLSKRRLHRRKSPDTSSVGS